MTVFSEKQSFRQWWFWALILFINSLIILAVISQVFFGNDFGDQPMSDSGLAVTLFITFLVTALLVSIRLETEIKSDGIYVRFFPFQRHFRFYPWDVIEKMYVRRYNPIAEYGGWGWRISLTGSGKAYNISGNMGLQLEFKDKSKLLIGTQNPEALLEALRKLN